MLNNKRKCVIHEIKLYKHLFSEIHEWKVKLESGRYITVNCKNTFPHFAFSWGEGGSNEEEVLFCGGGGGNGWV